MKKKKDYYCILLENVIILSSLSNKLKISLTATKSSVIVKVLDNLLRIEGVRNILCNRNNNINFDKVLEMVKLHLYVLVEVI